MKYPMLAHAGGCYSGYTKPRANPFSRMFLALFARTPAANDEEYRDLAAEITGLHYSTGYGATRPSLNARFADWPQIGVAHDQYRFRAPRTLNEAFPEKRE